MTMPPTEAKRKANEKHLAALKAAGWKSVTFRADPAMLERLEQLKAEHGSLQAVMAHLLRNA
jgi:hypothetical protein